MVSAALSKGGCVGVPSYRRCRVLKGIRAGHIPAPGDPPDVFHQAPLAGLARNNRLEYPWVTHLRHAYHHGYSLRFLGAQQRPAIESSRDVPRVSGGSPGIIIVYRCTTLLSVSQ